MTDRECELTNRLILAERENERLQQLLEIARTNLKCYRSRLHEQWLRAELWRYRCLRERGLKPTLPKAAVRGAAAAGSADTKAAPSPSPSGSSVRDVSLSPTLTDRAEGAIA